MTPIQTAITGKENLVDIQDTRIRALTEFYKAFNGRDFALMQKNWLNSEEIAMDNPLGGIKRGWEEIKEIYTRIFSGKAHVYVEYYDYSIIDIDGGFCAVGRERGSVTIGDKTLELAIRTSRVYKLIDGEYKQVHHHGSIENPTLLEAYQTLVK